MKNAIILLIGLLFITLISCNKTEKPKDPKELFIQANQSSLKINGAKLKVNFGFKSDQENYNTTMKISVKRDNQNKLGFKVRFSIDDGEGIYDGKKYYYRDDKSKKVYISGDQIEPEMFITQNWIINPITMVMLDKDYSEEIKKRSDELSYLTDAKVFNFNTQVVQRILPVDENKIDTKIITYFDTETHLPVKETKSQLKDKQFVSQTFEISELDVETKINDSEFVMDIPQGYVTETINPDSKPEDSKINAQAPDFTLNDLNGNAVTLSKLKGKVVILDFWGTWCKWCVKAMPKLQKVHENFKNSKVIVLGIS